jgi:hypothetical protein
MRLGIVVSETTTSALAAVVRVDRLGDLAWSATKRASSFAQSRKPAVILEILPALVFTTGTPSSASIYPVVDA